MTPEEPKETELNKYLRILKKRKKLVVITFLAVAIFAVLFVVFLGGGPVYTTQVLFTFQDPQTLSAVEDRVKQDNTASFNLITSNRLLSDVVQEMQLNVSVLDPDIQTDELFKFTNAGPSAIEGTYKLVPKGDDQVRLTYANEARKVNEKEILTFNVQDTVTVNNMTFSLNTDFFALHGDKNLEFSIQHFEKAVGKLRGMVKSLPDRRGTLLRVTLTHKNPKAAAVILNTLAEKFVDLNVEIKRGRKDEKYRNLENQLVLAERDIKKASQELQSFKERNPWVELTSATGRDVQTVTSWEDEKSRIGINIQDMKDLDERLGAATAMNTKALIARELITYLTSVGDPRASAFDQEYLDATTKRDDLLSRYPATNSFVLDAERELESLFTKVRSAAKDKVGQLEGRLKTLNRNLASQRNIMRNLPEKERQLAELLRTQRVAQDLYERIFGQYNQAKIGAQVEVSDVMILDRATVPVTQSPLVDILKKSILGIVAALGLAIGLAIVLELFDKTANSPEDLQSRMRMPVIGSIPVIQTDEELPENFADIKGKRDPKLITLDYSPTLESESYRDIRTKILFMNQSKNLSSFLVTSLSANEGKSLTCSNIAITIAQQKISTLIVDADLRRGVLHNVFGNKKNPGLSDFLISKATVDDDNVGKLIQKTFIPNLYLITTGSPIPNPTEMIGSERMAQLLNVLKSRFGMVIVDTAPLQASSDSAILSNAVEGSLIVVRANHTNVDLLRQKAMEYPNLMRSTLGLVLNMVRTDVKKVQYQSQYSYYNY